MKIFKKILKKFGYVPRGTICLDMIPEGMEIKLHKDGSRTVTFASVDDSLDATNVSETSISSNRGYTQLNKVGGGRIRNPAKKVIGGRGSGKIKRVLEEEG